MSGIDSVLANAGDGAMRATVTRISAALSRTPKPATSGPEPAGSIPPNVNRGSLEDRVAQVSRDLASLSPYVTFEVDREAGDVVVRVLDPQTREVVRQIPSDQLLALRRSMDDYLGMLADAAV
jgi:flagellar protein FlaG